MAVKLGVATRNARLNAIETYIGESPTLKIFTGAPPAACSSTDTGTVIATMTLPADWMDAADAGKKSLLGTWQDAAADADGTAGHFRIYKSAACELQGTAGVAGDAPDLVLDYKVFTAGIEVNITQFDLTDGNA